MDIVSHDARKFFGLLVKRNGYVLEQLFLPLIVHTTPEHAELKAICKPRQFDASTSSLSPREERARRESERGETDKTTSGGGEGSNGRHYQASFASLLWIRGIYSKRNARAE